VAVDYEDRRIEMPRTKGRAASLFDAPAVEEVAVEPSEPDPKLQGLHAAAAAKAAADEVRLVKRLPKIEKPEGFDHEDGIKSRARVQSIGEVLTGEREVNAMLDLVDDTVRRPGSRVLEPACGNGNFLVEILRRKLAMVAAEAKTPEAFEFGAITALTGTYGIDITLENVLEARERLRILLVDAYSTRKNTWRPNDGFYDSVQYILGTNIILGDSWKGAHKIVVVEYTSPFPGKFFQRFFTLAELERPSGRLPKPHRTVGATHYLELRHAD
jgi:hypothetical protein